MSMRIIIYLLCLMLGLPSCASTQNKQFVTPVPSKLDITERIDQVEIDNLQNIFILTIDDRILRYNSDLELKFEYRNGSIGDIVSIDATNPQKIICFVADFNRILVLDNTLAEIEMLDLSTTEYLDVTAVARSNDNKLWLFDPVNQVLVKIDNLGEEVFKSNRLSDYNLGEVNPTIIQEKDNKVAVVDEELGILIFDNFGQFLKLVPETDLDHIQMFGDYIFFSQHGEFYQYHLALYEKQSFEIDGDGFSKFKLTKEYVYLFGAEGLIRRSY